MNKKEKGITLIALIITIIVLLVLAASTIGILTNQGILPRVSSARDTQVVEQEKEAIKLGYNEYQIAKHEKAEENPELEVENADVKGSELEGGWTITFTNTTGNIYTLDEDGNINLVARNTEGEISRIKAGYKAYKERVNQEDLDLLTQYCIGNNDKDLAKDVLDFTTDLPKFQDRQPIPNASKELTFVDLGDTEVDGKREVIVYFTYKDNSYKIVAGWEYEIVDGSYSLNTPTKRVEPENPLTVEGAEVKNNENNGWTITFPDTGDKYTLNSDGTIEMLQGLELSTSELSIGVDEDNNKSEIKEIKAIKKGGLTGTVKWTVEDKSIATINKNSGTSIKVTAVSKGTTTVTATCGESRATATIKVGSGFKSGDIVLRVGDYVKYDATKDDNGSTLSAEYIAQGKSTGNDADQTFNVKDYSGSWRVLGRKDGKIQLIAESPIGSLTLQWQQGYSNAVKELNSISAIYGRGKGAESARSVNADDVNNITGYDPSKTGDGKAFGEGGIFEYGNVITYYWKGNSEPYCKGTNGSEYVQSRHQNGFYWYDDSGLHHADVSKTATNTEAGREKIVSLKNTRYCYYPSTLTTDENGLKKGISEDSTEYKMLFEQPYWLASTCISFGNPYVTFHVFKVMYGRVDSDHFYTSTDNRSWQYYNWTYKRGVRPVVTLSPDIKITTNGTQDGSSAAKAYTIE